MFGYFDPLLPWPPLDLIFTTKFMQPPLPSPLLKDSPPPMQASWKLPYKNGRSVLYKTFFEGTTVFVYCHGSHLIPDILRIFTVRWL